MCCAVVEIKNNKQYPNCNLVMPQKTKNSKHVDMTLNFHEN